MNAHNCIKLSIFEVKNDEKDPFRLPRHGINLMPQSLDISAFQRF